MLTNPSNSKLVTQIDALKGLTDSLLNMQQVQSAKIDSICDATARLSDGQSALYGGMDSIQVQLQTIAENGVGYSDALGHIAFPLIIALFAFAFTYLFSVITRINEKYSSEHISDMFKTCLAYRCYMLGSGISVFSIILMGVLSLTLTGTSRQVFMSIMSWCGLVVAGVYAGVILVFVRVCIKYDDNSKILDLISERYHKEKKKSCALNIRMQRQVAICKYAIWEQNENLFLAVLNTVSEQDKAEKDEKGRNFSFYTMLFYESIVDSFIEIPQDGETEKNLLWNWQQTFCHNQLPQPGVIYRMLGKLVAAVKRGRYSLFEVYMEKCKYGYDFINQMPKILYASGLNVAEQIKLDNERLEMWREIREMHYLAVAYLFSIGHYEVVSVLKKGVGDYNHSLIPTSAAGFLVLYAHCKAKQDKTSGSYNNKYWFLDKVIGYKYDRDILEKLTALILLMAVQSEEDEEHIVSDEERQVLLDSKADLIRLGHLWQRHSELLSRYPIIGDVKIESQIEEGMRHLTNGDYLDEKPMRKTFCEMVSDRLGWCTMKKRSEKPQANIFEEKITAKEESAIKSVFNNLLYSNRGRIVDGLEGDLTEDATEEILMGGYSFLARKQMVLTPEVWQDYGVFNDFKNVFKARYLFMVYEALSKMKIKDVTIKRDIFEKKYMKYITNEGKKYAIVDTNSMMDAMVSFDKPPEGQKWTFQKYYKGSYYYNAGLEASPYLRDLPLVDTFNETVMVVRLADMPVLMDTTEDGLPMVSIEDESNKVNGWASVRITVDPCLIAKYNKNAEVLRIRFKK